MATYIKRHLKLIAAAAAAVIVITLTTILIASHSGEKGYDEDVAPAVYVMRNESEVLNSVDSDQAARAIRAGCKAGHEDPAKLLRDSGALIEKYLDVPVRANTTSGRTDINREVLRAFLSGILEFCPDIMPND